MFRRFWENNGGNPTVLALSLARLGDAVGNSVLFVTIPLYVAALPAPVFGVPETVRIGILLSLYGLVVAIFQPFTGAWSDRVGKRKLFIQGGLVLMGLSTLAFVIANQFSELLVFRIIQGLGVAVTVPAAVALIAVSSHRKSRGGTMGIYTMFRMLGLGIGPLIGGAIYDRFGFSPSFYAATGFILLGVVVVQIFVHDIAERPNKSIEDPVEPPEDEEGTFKIFDFGLLSAGLVGAAFATFVMAAAFSMMTTLEAQFNARLGMTALSFGIAFSALMISRLIFQVPLGRLSDIWGRRPILIAGLLLMVPTTALLGYAASVFQLTALRVFQGVASAAIAAPAFAVAADLAKEGGEGRQMSIVTMGFGLGVALGPLIAGLLAIISFPLPFIVGGLLSLLGAWVIWRYVPETAPKSEGE